MRVTYANNGACILGILYSGVPDNFQNQSVNEEFFEGPIALILSKSFTVYHSIVLSGEKVSFFGFLT